MGLTVNNGQQDPLMNTGGVPGTTQDVQTFFGNGEIFLKALTGAGIKEVGATQTQAAAKDDRKMHGDVSWNGKNLGELSPADFEKIASVMMDPVAMASLGNNITLSLQVLAVLGKAGSVSENATVDGSAPAAEKSVLDKIGDSALKFKGGMFDEGAIALQEVLAEVAGMKKGQAYLMAQLSQQAMAALIDGAHTQAQIAIEKSQKEAFASFMNAGLAAVGATINLAGTAAAMKSATAASSGKIGADQQEIAEGIGKKAQEDAVAKSLKNPDQIGQSAYEQKVADFQRTNKDLSGQLLTARTTLNSALASVFSQVGTGIVDGFKSLEVGRLEAQKIVLDNAMQILSQMMSKFSEEERGMHDDVTKAYDAMKQLHEAMVTNINKLSA